MNRKKSSFCIIAIISIFLFFPYFNVQAIKIKNWQTIFTGYGRVKIEKKQILLRPKKSTEISETHAALVVGPELKKTYKYLIDLKTIKQFRQNSEPNPWEVGWVIWNYLDNEHFYYFIPKPNGWELGKRDPVYEGGQRFLATGNDILFPIQKKYSIRIIQRKKRIIIYVNKKKIVEYTDKKSPYLKGRAGVYCEDAKVIFKKIKIKNQ